MLSPCWDSGMMQVLEPGVAQREALRHRSARVSSSSSTTSVKGDSDKMEVKSLVSWRRILLLIIAITVHNIPGVCVCVCVCVYIGMA